MKFPTDVFGRPSLTHSIPAHVGGETIPIGPLELGIPYTLSLGARKDLEDAAHLYALFGQSLSTRRLEKWVDALDVHDAYGRLTRLRD